MNTKNLINTAIALVYMFCTAIFAAGFERFVFTECGLGLKAVHIVLGAAVATFWIQRNN